MYRILRCLALFGAVVFSSNVFAAGYTCDSIKQYTSCNANYYLSNCGSKRDGSTATPSVGNSCAACPSGYKCDGGTKCPYSACVAITLNNTTNGGTDGTTTVYMKAGSTSFYSNSTCTTTTTLTGPTKTNATYAGHYTSSSGGTQCITSSGTWSSSCSVPTAATTYYARYDCNTGWTNSGTTISGACTANCIAITLNNTTNGGTGGTTTVYKRVGSTTLYSNSFCSTTVSIRKPTKTHGTYAGHYDTSAASGGTQCITASGTWSSSCNPTAATTYYARYNCNTGWTNSGTTISDACTANTYTVTYNLNNGAGTAPSNTTCTYGSTCTLASLSATTYYRGGYKIVGWSTSSTATSGITSTTGLTTTNGGTVTVYAVWSACASGTYHPAATGTAANSCTAAGKGYYVSGTGATSQSACAVGQYQDATGQSSCKSCPTLTSGYAYAGSTAKQAVTSCVETKAATAISNLCKSGTLQKTAKDTTTWNTATESVTVNANAGAYVTGSGDNRTCTTCTKNSYCTGDTAAPVACSAISGTGGLYNLTASTGASAATQCYASVAGGKYIAKLTDTAVSTCPNWTYKAAHNVYYSSTGGTSSCTACPAVETNWSKKDSSGTGWSSNTSCVEVRNATNVSSYCSAGQLQKVATTTPAWPTTATISVAFQAKAGSFVNGQTCEQCAAGSYTSAAGTQTSCTACETGKYNAEKGQTSCLTCVNGTTNTGTGNTACGTACVAIDGLATWSGSALCTVDKCASGRYKSGNTCPTCSSATNSLYDKSAQGTTSVNSCYLTTDAGKYVATAKAGQVDCPANSYCVGGVTIYYGTGTTTGGSATCASGTSSKYAKSAAKSSKVGQCYLSLTAGKQVATAGAGITDCSAGRYCTSTANIYYNTDGGTATYTGSACSALGGGLYTNSAAGSDANTDCYIAANTISGKYLTVNTATALTTCEAGYKCPATAVYWPNVGNRAACTGATYAASTGQTSCTACPTATNATDVTSYGYWNGGKDGDHTLREGCNATFKAKSVPNGSMTAYHCYIDKDADSYGIAASGKICWVNTSELKCNAGYYNAAANGGATQPSASTLESLWNNACVQVGAGYWSAANSLSRTQCATGLTTIGYGAGADEAADCGRILNAGDRKVYLRSEKKTTPSLNVKIGETTYYGNMTSGALDGYLIIKDGNVTYRVHDDSK